MHSTEIMYTDRTPGHDQPWTGGPELFGAFHNGDYSGDVWFDMEAWRVTLTHEAESQFARHGQAIVQAKIPFEVLAKIVADAVRDQRVSSLEQADYKEVLGLL